MVKEFDTSIFPPPFLQILILHLKRFSFRNFIWRDKINKLVEFPLTGLDLRKYCPSLNNDGDNAANGSSGKNISSSSVYDLYAVINHFGGIMGGHYTAYARLPAEGRETWRSELPWRLFDDSHVTPVSRESDVVTRNAYVLFYVRRDLSEADRRAALSAAAAAAMDDDDDDDDFEDSEDEEESFRVSRDRFRHRASANISGDGGGRQTYATTTTTTIPTTASATFTLPRSERDYRNNAVVDDNDDDGNEGVWRKGSDASTCTEDTLLSSPGTDCDSEC